MSESNSNIIDLSTEVVSSYLTNNKLAASEIPALIASVHGALDALASGKVEEPTPELHPAISIKKSITPDAIICLEDGKAFKSLKRHLRTKYNLSPEDYRAKWGLPTSYPMVAPNYAASRSALAKNMGLGQQRRKMTAAAPAPAPKPKGRPRKSA